MSALPGFSSSLILKDNVAKYKGFRKGALNAPLIQVHTLTQFDNYLRKAEWWKPHAHAEGAKLQNKGSSSSHNLTVWFYTTETHSHMEEQSSLERTSQRKTPSEVPLSFQPSGEKPSLV